MAMQRYDASVLKDGHPDPITGRGTWEEYRYDALGRRVVTIVRRGLLALCSPQISPECDSYEERVVWDGDDLLYEHREGGSQYTGGSVGYVQGGVIDQPLAQLNGRILNPNWRGLYESSVLPNGTRGDCSLPGSGACTTVSWPAGQGVYYIRFPVSGGASTPTWIGSLASNGEGSTGLLYRRIRFYDPATGQFTQEDPIGLAGGLNLYGYAGGDPVNFSDPFGLCPVCDLADVGFFLYSVGKAVVNPTKENWKSAGLDAIGLLPIVPSVGMLRRLDDLADAAKALDKGGELTGAGRALEKHGSRGGAFPRVTGNAAAKNAAAQEIVEDILTSPGGRTVNLTSGRFKGGMDVYAPDGRGVRYDRDGKFVGFLEPPR